MFSSFDSLADFLTSTELVLGVLWAGLAALSATLLILMWTRWGQSRPLRKCLFLSLMAHALLFGYSTTVQIFIPAAKVPGEPAIRVSLADIQPDREAPANEASPDADKPWETLPHDSVAQPDLDEPSKVETPELPEPQRKPPPVKTAPPEPVNLDHLPLADAAEPEASFPAVESRTPATVSGKSAEPIEAPPAQAREVNAVVAPAPPLPVQAAAPSQPTLPEREAAGLPSALLEHPGPLPRMEQAARTSEAADSLADLADVPSSIPRGKPAEPIDQRSGSAGAEDAGLERLRPPSLASLGDKTHAGGEAAPVSLGPMVDVGPPQVSLRRADAAAGNVPELYRLRVADDRDARAREHGATAESEAAVSAGLKWLADHQEPNGRWCPAHYEGNQETLVAGEDRRGATMQADTGMTGLALLALLAAGNTPHRGEYQTHVQRGLAYLMRTQKSDGSLAGEANVFAAMYCHAMAALAMGEAYAMTADERLEEPLRRAVAYTVATQDPAGGGWRYLPRSPGDTSQFGWQVMVLKSAELSGISMPDTTRQGMLHYLKTVSSGQYGGLASYRIGHQVTRPMTAEALVCRQFLGMPEESPTGDEAGDYLLGELPGQGRDNLYYWYYGTLAMYHLQGDHWRQWNNALQRTLLARQRRSGELAGSWDPATVWGSYGGRIYSTAMATLCLEVYYRFLPLYSATLTADKRTP